MTFSDLIHHDAIVAPMAATDRDAAVRELMAALVMAGAVPQELAEPLVAAVIEREKKGSTGFGKGVAMPHVKHKRIAAPIGAIGISPDGVDFRSLDGQPVHCIVLLLSPESADQHLAAMNVIWPNLNNDRFRKFLRQARSRAEVVELLDEAQG